MVLHLYEDLARSLDASDNPLVQLLLTMVVDGNDHITYKLPAGTTVHLGRDPNVNEIIFHDASVSRSHALIRPAISGFVLEDLDSKKGTFLNGRQIDAPHPIHTGDVLEIGPFVLVIAVEGLHEVRPTEQTHNLEFVNCPNCDAHVLQDFDSCLVCGTPI